MALWAKVKKDRLSTLTTNFVLSELITLVTYRFGAPKAHQVGGEIYHSQAIGIFSLTRELEFKALEWLERFSDQKFSMTDAASFAVMKEHEVKSAFTFDYHFTIAGYQILKV